MNNDQLYNRIRELISKGNTDKAIEEVELFTQTEIQRNNVTVLKAKWAEVKRKEIIGAISNEDLLIEKAKVNDSVLSFLEKIQKDSTQEKITIGANLLRRKYLITGLILLISLTIIFVWNFNQSNPTENELPQSVSKSYVRMITSLSELNVNDNGDIYVNENLVPERLKDYYTDYVAIGDYIKNNPNNLSGAYEFIWNHGGGSRAFINDTDRFETVVSAFFYEYKNFEQREN